MVEGDEPIHLAWYKDGLNVSEAENGLEINLVGHDSILRISRLGEQHIGNYTCQASNLAGAAAIAFFVEVKGRSKGTDPDLNLLLWSR